MKLFKTDSFGDAIRKLRVGKKKPLRTLAAYLDIDQAILSKIERGQRKASREIVIKLATYFKIEREELLVAWLSDKLVNELSDEKNALKALQVAEEKITYLAFRKTDRNKITDQLKSGIKKFKSVQKAWIYGSFARGDDGPESDIDIALKTDEGFSYFDMAEIQYELERTIKRKVDLGFIDSFKSHLIEHVKSDLNLIYERHSS
jgi:predicted nucleotidyltransferase/plasmid maintenance system antidote protein VapI